MSIHDRAMTQVSHASRMRPYGLRLQNRHALPRSLA